MHARILALLSIVVLAAGCGGSRDRVRNFDPPPMIGQAKSGAEKVRLGQLHLMAQEDAAARR